tara:strand:+ start:490 stop:1020 length:531 start_codon:yes stop_codon:yes gene_type:complete
LTEIDSLFDELLEQQRNKKLPPVETWKPKNLGAIDIKISRDGTWVHEGGEIKRKELVQLFSTILVKEENSYFLVTPVQKLKIEVEDAPFVAVSFQVRGEPPETDIIFETNVGDLVVLNKEHILWVAEGKPYIHVRYGLNALLTRNAFYQLIDYGVEKNDQLIIYSSGSSFSLGPIT